MADVPLTEKRLTEILVPLMNNRFTDFEKKLTDINTNMHNRFADADMKLTDMNTSMNNRFTDAETIFTKLLIFLKDKFESIDNRFESIDNRFESIDKQLRGLLGFQENESHAIEYELQMILKAHLKKINNGKQIVPYEMKSIKNPYTGKELTEFDGAFIVEPTTMPYYNLSRLQKLFPKKKKTTDSNTIKTSILSKKNKKINNNNFTKKNNRYINDSTPKGFVLAEAKHHINADKIKTKLEQFTQILEIFKLAKEIKGKPRDKVDPRINRKFITQVERDKYMSSIDINQCFLYFGAAYWDSGLLRALRHDLKEHADEVSKFYSISNKIYDVEKQSESDTLLQIEKSIADKIQIYKRTIRIELKWYIPKILTDEEASRLEEIKSPFSQIRLIIPSGNRFIVDGIVDEPEGFSLKGGKTPKNRV